MRYEVQATRVTTYIVYADSEDEAIDRMIDGDYLDEDTETIRIDAEEADE